MADKGITWLNLGQDISGQYIIRTKGFRATYWPENLPGVNPDGALFDSIGGKMLYPGDEVVEEHDYYLLTDSMPPYCGSIHCSEVARNSIRGKNWRVYKIRATAFSSDTVRYFLLLHMHLVKKKVSLTLLWPPTVNVQGTEFHNSSTIYVAHNGNLTLQLLLFPTGQQLPQQRNGYFCVASNGFQQMAAVHYHDGQRSQSNHTMLWKGIIAKDNTEPVVIISDGNGTPLTESDCTKLPAKGFLRILAPFDGKINKELQQVRQDQKNRTRTLDETKHQIELAKKHLAELQGTIQENERIAQDSYRLVQDKLASTKANVAEFLAEMSLYMPISANGTNNSPKSATIHHGDRLDEEVVDLVDDYNIVMAELADNLSSCAGITKERSHHLHMARFLYATHLRHQSLLLAGLNSEEIAQTLSATIYGRYADVLVCTEDYNEKASTEAMQGEGILLVRNPFCGDWLQNLLRDMATSRKQIIFCHPYTEDLSIEPESLFQYLIPVFTTDFVEHQAEIADATGTILAPDGKAFEPSTKPGLRRDWLDSLKISSMMQKKIQGILSDVAVMAEADDMNNATAAFEYTLLPYAAVTRKGEQFCKRIQESNAVPTEVKSHIYHFFDYEEE